MGRMRRGWELTKTSWGVLRADRSLAVFPVLAGLTTLLLGAAFGLPAWVLFDDDQNVPGVILAVVGIYALTFAGTFFNVALAAGAAQVLDGEDATVASGIAVARRRLGAIAGWAALVASVNIIIRGLAERAGPLADVLLGGLAVAWNLVTFLAVPVLTLEGTGPIETLKRSARIFRERWGEQITGQFSIGGIVILAAIIPVAVLGLIGYAVGGVGRRDPDRARGGRADRGRDRQHRALADLRRGALPLRRRRGRDRDLHRGRAGIGRAAAPDREGHHLRIAVRPLPAPGPAAGALRLRRGRAVGRQRLADRSAPEAGPDSLPRASPG